MGSGKNSRSPKTPAREKPPSVRRGNKPAEDPEAQARREARARFFDPESWPDPHGKGERAIRFIENLTLSDDYKGQPFVLRPWQKTIIRRIFGHTRADGRRWYHDVYLSFGRKQAKTQLSAAIGLYLLLGTGETGQQIVVAAGSIKQAKNLFDKCLEMRDADPWLSSRCSKNKSDRIITAYGSGNCLFVVSAQGALQHGLNPGYVLFDELHVQPDGVLYEALTSGQGTRKNRLNIFITTAGNRFDSVCRREYERAKRAEANPAKYPEYLPVIFEVDADADWRDPAVWPLALPGLGDFFERSFLEAEYQKALDDPQQESTFRQLYLNQWVASARKWLHRPKWEACGRRSVDPDDLVGRDCYGGLDLSCVDDFTAFVLVFPMDDESYRVRCWFWLPDEAAAIRDHKDRSARFRAWGKAGHLELVPGDTIEYSWIFSAIKKASQDYSIKRIYVDRCQATQLALQVRDELDLSVHWMQQTTVEMNEPVKFLDLLIRKDRFHHGNHPVLNWMADNVVSVKDSNGNTKFSKGKSADKVDGMVALAMALAAHIKEIPEDDPDFQLLSKPRGYG